MNPTPPSTQRLDWLRLFLEFVIVVVGISMSFWVQDWRQGRAEVKEEARYLEGLKLDIAGDRQQLIRLRDDVTDRVRRLNMGIDPEQREALTAEELDVIMDDALTYGGFTPIMSTYLELRHSGESSIIRDKALLGAVINLYERVYGLSSEWDRINRSFVLDRMFPFVESRGPALTSTVDRAFAAGYQRVFLALKEDTQFQNLLRTNIIFKQGQLQVYEGILEGLDRILERLNEASSNAAPGGNR